jgi:hypothetical protein
MADETSRARRRRAFTALAVAALLAGCGGSKPSPPVETVAAEPTPCVADDALYGTPAAGFEYIQLEGDTRRAALESISLDLDEFGDADARLAARTEGKGDNALLVAVPLEQPEHALEDFARGARASGKPVERRAIAGHDVRWADYGADGSIAVSLKGCHLVWVVAADMRTTRRLARAVFS